MGNRIGPAERRKTLVSDLVNNVTAPRPSPTSQADIIRAMEAHRNKQDATLMQKEQELRDLQAKLDAATAKKQDTMFGGDDDTVSGLSHKLLLRKEINQLNAEQDELAMLQDRIGRWSENRNALAGMDLTPLLVMTDQWSGDNTVQSYKPPESAKERDAQLNELRERLSRRRTTLVTKLEDIEAKKEARSNNKMTEAYQAADRYKNTIVETALRPNEVLQARLTPAQQARLKDADRLLTLFQTNQRGDIQVIPGADIVYNEFVKQYYTRVTPDMPPAEKARQAEAAMAAVQRMYARPEQLPVSFGQQTQ